MTSTFRVRGGLDWFPQPQVAALDDPRAAVAANLFPLPGGAYNNHNLTTNLGTYSLWTEGDVQYAVWVEASTRNPIIGKRTLPSGAWSTFDLSTITGNPLAAPTDDDGHNTYVVAVDLDGFIHVAGNMHVDALRYVMSTSPGDITAWDAGTMVGTDESAVTYPRFYRNATHLLFTYRDGGSGDGDQFFNVRASEESWVREGNIVQGRGSDPTRNPYVSGCVGPTGRLHLFWCWRRTTSVFTNHDVLYAARDTDGTWRKSDGTAYTLPITHDNAERLVAVAESTGLFNALAVGVTSDDLPRAAYLRNDQAGFTQIFLLTFNGQTWTEAPVTDSARTMDLSAAPIDVYLGSPGLAVDTEDRTFVLLRHNEGERGGTIRLLNTQTQAERILLRFLANQMRFTIDPQAVSLRNELHFLAGASGASGQGSTPAGVASVDLAAVT